MLPSIHRPTLLGLLFLKAGLHLLAIVSGYGLHRDEFLYLSEGSHPAWGYMEGPPVIGWVAGLSKLVFGGSVLAAKVPVLLVGLASVYVLLLLVREFGGGKYAQLVAGAAWVLSPAFLGSNALFQPVSFNQFCWLLIGWGLVRTIKYRRPKDWYLLGAVTGLALLTKYSVVFYLLALGAGLLLTPQRKLFTDKYLWRAAGLAFLLWLPNLIWQYGYGFPVVSHMRELAGTQLVNVSATDFLVPQFLFHWAGLLVWLPGVYALLRLESLRKFRALGWAYPALLLLLLVLSGKAYYTIGIYTSLLAAGGIIWEHWWRERSRWLLPVLLTNFLLLPYGLPVLPVEQMQAYGTYMRDAWGISAPLRWEDGSIRDLSQDYADMHGWEEMVAAVAKLYHSLPPEEQEKCLLYASNYGQAGALDFYRKKYDLPPPVSYHASFLLWLDDGLVFDRQISVEDYPQEPSEFFRETEKFGTVTAPHARETHHLYYYSDPSSDPAPAWKKVVTERKAVLQRAD